jgi:hypothetical protein
VGSGTSIWVMTGADSLTLTFPTAKAFEAERDRAFHGFTELVDRAKASGRLRDDFCSEDLAMMLMATAGVLGATRDFAPQTSRRLVAHFLQACDAATAGRLPDPPTKRQMYRLLLRLQPKRP